MRIAIEVDERAFLRPKSREEIEREVLEAVSIYWLARREIAQAQSRKMVRPSPRNVIDVLLSAPAVGEDADFERVQDSAGLRTGVDR
jgi:hypothetical protein